MKKLILLILIALNSVGFAQNYQWQNSYISANQENIRSLSFINPNTGWVGLEIVNTNARVLKTTNKGNSFSEVFKYTDYSSNNMSYDIGVCFINESIGFISTGDKIFKTANGGGSWSIMQTFPNRNASSAIKFADVNTGYAAYSADYNFASLYKTTNGGATWYLTCINEYFSSNVSNVCITDISISINNPNITAICGYYRLTNSYDPISFLIKSENGFQSNSFTHSYYDAGLFSHINMLPNNEVRVFGMKGIYEPNTYGSNLIFDMGTTNNGANQIGMSFSNQNLGFAASYDGKIWRTTNAGYNYVNEANTGISYPWSSRMNSFNEIAYFGANGNIFTRLLKSNLSLNGESGILTTSSKIKFDFTDYTNGLDQYLRGGYSNIQSDNVLNSGAANEMIFYKWQDNKMANVNPNYYFDYPHDIKAYYKTKQKSTDETAIANVNQTKAIRGVNGSTFQIHSSIGGIFYTASTSQNSGFGSEIVVNTNDDYAQLPNSNTADNNKNPSINVIKYFETDNSSLPAAYTMASAWERFDQNTNKTDILCALSMGTSTSPWIRFGNNLSALDGKITTINNTSLSFNSKPDVYSMHISGATDDVRNYLMIVPHLEPSENNYKLVTSVRYQNVDCFDYEALRLEDPDFETNDFKIVSDNVTDFSVTYKPVTYNSQKAVYLYFTYKKNGNIYYKRDLIYFLSNGNYSQVIREEIPVAERDFDLSTIDGQSQCNTPDITLRNGMPVITYQGKYDVNREVYYEGNISGPTVPLHYYPIFVKMRDANGDCYPITTIQTASRHRKTLTLKDQLIMMLSSLIIQKPAVHSISL